MTVDSIRADLLAKKRSAEEIAREALKFAEAENPKTNAYLTFAPERALAAARAVDQKIASGSDPGPLAGVPIGVKDVILTRGLRTTCASRMLETYIPPYDATAVIRIEQAGGVIIGKTNCDEFAMGSSNENSAFGPVRNPVALDRVPGGSSGGSAAVIAQGTAVLSLGSDTGGSIRQPASFCGVTGVTPTYGRVSRYGLTAFASSLDHIGPFSRTVRDSARLLQVMAGRDEMDSTSAFAPVPDYVAALDGNIRGMKIGVPKEFFDGLASDTGDLFKAAIGALRETGMRNPRDRASPHSLRGGLLLHYLYSGSELESGSLRRRSLYAPIRRRGYFAGDVSQDAGRRVRCRVQAPYHAGNLRAQRGLLRRILSESPESSGAGGPGLRAGVRAGGCDRRARVAFPGVQAGREGR